MLAVRPSETAGTAERGGILELTGAVALITGGASGLGAATARRLYDGGASVVLVDLPQSAGEAYAKELGERAVFAPADVTSEADVQAAVDAAAGLGPLRVVVNCAGVGTPGKVLGRNGVLPLADFARVVQINLVGTFNVIRLAAAAMAETEPVATEAGGRARRHRQHRLRGGVRRADRPARLRGIQGRRGGHDPAARPRIGALADPGGHHRSRHLRNADDGRPAAGGPGVARAPGPAPRPGSAGPRSTPSLAAHIVDNAMLNGETIRLDGAIRMAPK